MKKVNHIIMVSIGLLKIADDISPPRVRPPASGSLGSPVCPTARADGPSLAQRSSLGVLPRDLDKRAHLGEQQGGNTQPAAPRPVNRRRVQQAQRIAPR